MQTRKRAKSVTFGKKSPVKAEKETVKKTEDEVVEREPSSEKAEIVERAIPDKPEQDGLSATPPKEEAEAAQPSVETPQNEFIADSPLSSAPELPKDEKEKPSDAIEPQPVAPVASEGLSAPIETPAQPVASPDQQGQQPESQELSSTLPPSAFTIQSNEQPEQPEPPTAIESTPTGGKKRFGLYFIVVALLSFILGLGAMAGASYFGLLSSNFSKLPSTMQLPAIGQKPTPTALPPTATPTQKPFNLSAYSLTVLNGSGISGKAATVKSDLTTAGFKVASTGNADNSNFTKTEISAKKSVNQEFLKKLEAELGKSFTVDTQIAASPDSDTADVTITLGSDTK